MNLTQPNEREDWETQFDMDFRVGGSPNRENYQSFWCCESGYCQVSVSDIKNFIRNLLKSHNDALVAEIEKLEDHNSENYGPVARFFCDGFNEALGQVISLIKKEK